MGYSSGMLNKQVKIFNHAEHEAGTMGLGSGGIDWVHVQTVPGNLKWNRGVKAMREGALDAYDVVMIRTRFTPMMNRESMLEVDGRKYRIESFWADRRENVIQVTATEMVE